MQPRKNTGLHFKVWPDNYGHIECPGFHKTFSNSIYHLQRFIICSESGCRTGALLLVQIGKMISCIKFREDFGLHINYVVPIPYSSRKVCVTWTSTWLSNGQSVSSQRPRTSHIKLLLSQLRANIKILLGVDLTEEAHNRTKFGRPRAQISS